MIKRIVKMIDEVLQGRGFKREGLTWSRDYDGIIQLLNLQRSRFDAPGTFDVTLNIGIWIEHVWKICWNKPVPKVIRVEECFPQFRIAQLLSDFSPKTKDKWWRGTNLDDADRIGKELAILVKNRVLPFLEHHISEATIKELVTSNVLLTSQPAEKIYLSILAHRTGDERFCEKLLNELQQDKKLSAWHERVKSVRYRLHHRTS